MFILDSELTEANLAHVSQNAVSSRNNPELSVIVPTYNESENIVELVDRIEKLIDFTSFELVIVDDNSPDGTDKIAEALNDKYGNIKICRRSGKHGLSSAVFYGFEKATTKILAVIDADLQHPPEILPKLYATLSEGYDLVVASRYVDGGGIEDWALNRMILSRGAITLAHLFLPKTRRVKDATSGCFVVRREVMNGVKFDTIGFKLLLEILARCKLNQVAEVPYRFKNRCNGNSNLNLKEIGNYAVLIFKIFRSSFRNVC
jgi:dolichol-phosphate mannosyltransferase